MGPEGDGTAVLNEAVFPVPYQGQAPGGKLAADLVGAAGDEPDLYQAQALRPPQGLIAQYGLLHPLAGGVGHIGLALSLVPGQKVHHLAPLSGLAVDHSQIVLVKAALPDLAGQRRGRSRVPGQHHQPADHPVQPVYRADVPGAQLRPQQLRQTAGLVGGEHPRGLDAYNHVFVRVKNVHTISFLYAILKE